MAEQEQTSYVVMYRETEGTTLLDHDTIQHLETEGVTLEEVIENCASCHCNAALYDAQGFVKGWVHADGDYRLA